VAAASGHRPASYPVPYSFVPDMLAASSGAPPPGANICSCHPSEAHPYPVILVHGLLSNQSDNWQTYGPPLANHGYCVFSLTYGTRSTTPPLRIDAFGGTNRRLMRAADTEQFEAGQGRPADPKPLDNV
jgi:hypothetical protein